MNKYIIPIYITLSLYGYQVLVSIFWRLGEANTRIVTVPYRIFMFCFSFYLFIFYPHPKKANIKRSKYYDMFCLYIIIYIIKVLFDLSINPEKAGDMYNHVLSFILIIILPSFFASTRFIYSVDYEIINKFLICAIVFATVLTVASEYTLLGAGYTGRQGRMGLGESGILDSISSGQLGASCLLISLTAWPWTFNRNRVIVFLLFALRIFLMVISLYLIVIAGSKGPLFTLCGSFVFLLLSNQGHYKFVCLFIFIMLLLFYKEIVSFTSEISPVLYERVLTLIENGDTERELLIKSALDEFMKHPLGGGYFMVPYRIYSHNIFIDCLMSWGIIGLVYFSLLAIKALYNSYYYAKTDKKNKHLISLLFVQHFLACNTSGALYIYFPLILLFLLVLYEDESNNCLMNIILPQKTPEEDV